MKLWRWLARSWRQFFCCHDYTATVMPDGKTRFICQRCQKQMGDYKL